MSACNWVFTLNNPSIESGDDNPADWPGVKYLVYQLECGESGTVHWQGYLIMNDKVRLSAMKKLNPRCHWAIRRGTHEEARAYVMKDESRIDGPYESGQPPAQGTRSDLESVREMLVEGSTCMEVADAYFGQWVRYNKAFVLYRNMKIPDRHHVTECRVYWGAPGVGKSRRALMEAPNAFQKHRGDWWDGYDAHETVIMDDFYGWVQYSALLTLLDRYPHWVPVKGAFVKFVAKLVIITSNKAPADWYRAVGCDFAPLSRRLTVVEHMGADAMEDGTVTRVGYSDEPPARGE